MPHVTEQSMTVGRQFAQSPIVRNAISAIVGELRQRQAAINDVRPALNPALSQSYEQLMALAGDTTQAEVKFRASLAAGPAKTEPGRFLPLYKFDDELELAMANAALHGKGL